MKQLLKILIAALLVSVRVSGQPGPPPPVRLGAGFEESGNFGSCYSGVIIDSATDLHYVENLKSDRFSDLTLYLNLPSIPKEFKGFKHVRRLFIVAGEELKGLDGLNYFPNLVSLGINGFCGKEITNTVLSLDSLKNLDISSCQNLISLNAFKHLTGITKLEVICCPSIHEFPKWAENNQLKFLNLNNGNGFRNWERSSNKISTIDLRNLQYLMNLEEFKFSQYSCLAEIPDYLPQSVIRLSIQGKGYQEGFDDLIISDLSNLSKYPNLKEVELYGFILNTVNGNFKGCSLDKMSLVFIRGLSDISDLFSYDSIGTLRLQYCPELKKSDPVSKNCSIDLLQMEKVPLQDVSFLLSCTGIKKIKIGRRCSGDDYS